MSRLKKFLEVSGRERRVFLEALIMHMWIGLLLKFIPFRWIPRLFDSKVESRKSKVESPGNLQAGARFMEREQAEHIKSAIQRAGRVSPWKNRCLVSSLAGRCMLRCRKIESQISLGVAKDVRGKMTAHAWLISDGLEIVPSGGRFHELYQF